MEVPSGSKYEGRYPVGKEVLMLVIILHFQTFSEMKDYELVCSTENMEKYT